MRSCRCTSLTEALVPRLDEFPRRLQVGPTRKNDPCSVERLERMNERGAVRFGKNVVADLEHIIGAETEEIAVECRVMERAEGNSVSDQWFAGGIGIGDDMSRVEKFLVTQSAECALALVRFEHPFAESALMKSEAHHGGGIEAPRCVSVLAKLRGRFGRPQSEVSCIIDGHCEGEAARLIRDDKYGPGSEVAPRDDSVKVNKRKTSLHCETEASVVGMLRVRTSVSIPEKSIWTEGVVVRACWRCGDRERSSVQDLWLEDALGADERDSRAVKQEAGREKRPWQDVPVAGNLIRQPFERRRPDTRITNRVKHRPSSLSLPNAAPSGAGNASTPLRRYTLRRDGRRRP
jgi:hypothetical protein